jgi:SAM-dependent methyltransferase
MAAPLYDEIGTGYAARRSEDPGLCQRIEQALAGCHSVVNVGAGTGSYEPAGKQVIPIEPSAVMIRQRPSGRAAAIKAFAQDLPLADNSVDAAMSVLSIHHWHPDQARGIAEMCRVARERVLVVTFDPAVSGSMWLMADYLTEVRDLDHMIFPAPEEIAAWIDPGATVQTLPISRHSPDHNLASFWAHPERVLDEAAREATSGFARQAPAVQERVVSAVARDLESGAWEEKYGYLRRLDSFDAGLRLVVGQP